MLVVVSFSKCCFFPLKLLRRNASQSDGYFDCLELNNLKNLHMNDIMNDIVSSVVFVVFDFFAFPYIEIVIKFSYLI